MEHLVIVGTVRYQDINGGFWGIIADDAYPWRPENMPQDLEKEGLRIRVWAVESEDDMSIFMWGTPIIIEEYETLASELPEE
jgi:hypothetical protein